MYRRNLNKKNRVILEKLKRYKFKKKLLKEMAQQYGSFLENRDLKQIYELLKELHKNGAVIKKYKIGPKVFPILPYKLLYYYETNRKHFNLLYSTLQISSEVEKAKGDIKSIRDMGIEITEDLSSEEFINILKNKIKQLERKSNTALTMQGVFDSWYDGTSTQRNRVLKRVELLVDLDTYIGNLAYELGPDKFKDLRYKRDLRDTDIVTTTIDGLEKTGKESFVKKFFYDFVGYDVSLLEFKKDLGKAIDQHIREFEIYYENNILNIIPIFEKYLKESIEKNGFSDDKELKDFIERYEAETKQVMDSVLNPDFEYVESELSISGKRKRVMGDKQFGIRTQMEINDYMMTGVIPSRLKDKTQEEAEAHMNQLVSKMRGVQDITTGDKGQFDYKEEFKGQFLFGFPEYDENGNLIKKHFGFKTRNDMGDFKLKEISSNIKNGVWTAKDLPKKLTTEIFLSTVFYGIRTGTSAPTHPLNKIIPDIGFKNEKDKDNLVLRYYDENQDEWGRALSKNETWDVIFDIVQSSEFKGSIHQSRQNIEGIKSGVIVPKTIYQKWENKEKERKSKSKKQK